MKNNKLKMISLSLSLLMLMAGCSAQAYPKADYQKKSESVYLMAGRVTGTSSDISSKLGGKVTEIFVKEGDKVLAGTPLLRIEAPELEAQMAQANAGVQVAQANYEKVKSGARAEQKTQARAALDSASKSKTLAEENYKRDKSLYEAGAISKQQLETTELQLQSASSQETSARAQLELLEKGETKETLNVSKGQVEQAQSAANVVKAQLENQIIRAPYDGVVSKKYIEIGEMASLGGKLFTIQGNGNMKVEGNLPESLISKVKEGSKVLVRFPDLSKEKEFEGIVTFIDEAIDSSGKGRVVQVSVTTGDLGIKSGMFAEVGVKK